jgi:hypothetical protein
VEKKEIELEQEAESMLVPDGSVEFEVSLYFLTPDEFEKR